MSKTRGGPMDGEFYPWQLNVMAQYIKDLSFENPYAPRSLILANQQPKFIVQASVDAAPMSETDFEVTLKIEGRAESDGKFLFIFELAFAGMFRIRNAPPESMNAIALIECPRLLFPFAREIIADIVRNGGFPPLLIDPVDFVQLYRERTSRMQASVSS